MNFSRTVPRQFDDVDLGKVIRETLTLVEHQFAKSGIRVELELQEPLPSIRGNAGQLQQVFLNLFLNARDAMEQRRHAGGQGLGRRERACEVEVADTGPGIAPEHLHQNLRSVLHHQGGAQRAPASGSRSRTALCAIMVG